MSRPRSVMALSHAEVCSSITRSVRTCVVSAVWIHADALVAALSDAPGLEIIGSVLAGPDTAAAIAELTDSPDAILFDDRIAANLSVIQSLHDQYPDARLIAMGVDDSEEEIVSCARAGMAGYIDRHARLENLAQLIISVVRGELVCSPTMAAKLFRRLAVNTPDGARDLPLTSREREVLHLIRRGLANKEIAGQLQIAEATVKNHVHHLLEKLQVKRRVQAARMDVAEVRTPISRRA